MDSILGELKIKDGKKRVVRFYTNLSWIDFINDPSFVKLVK